jgi:hypothetical protein
MLLIKEKILKKQSTRYRAPKSEMMVASLFWSGDGDREGYVMTRDCTEYCYTMN